MDISQFITKYDSEDHAHTWANMTEEQRADACDPQAIALMNDVVDKTKKTIRNLPKKERTHDRLVDIVADVMMATVRTGSQDEFLHRMTRYVCGKNVMYKPIDNIDAAEFVPSTPKKQTNVDPAIYHIIHKTPVKKERRGIRFRAMKFDVPKMMSLINV